MSIAQIIVWLQIGPQLIGAGIATIQNIRTWLKAQHPGLTDADLNAILDAISAGALRHKALADADAGQA